MTFEVKYPILGFENVGSFEFERVDDNFATIKNSETGLPSFSLVNPFILREYTFDIPFPIKTLMDITAQSNLLVYLIIVLKQPFDESTANFLAPLVFNVDNKTMAQVVLDETLYTEYTVAESLKQFIKE